LYFPNQKVGGGMVSFPGGIKTKKIKNN
jgi:hypothetical protein